MFKKKQKSYQSEYQQTLKRLRLVGFVLIVCAFTLFVGAFKAHIDFAAFEGVQMDGVLTLFHVNRKFAKVLLVLLVLLFYRMWLKSQKLGVRFTLNVVFWGGLFLYVKYNFAQMSAMDAAALPLKVIDFITYLNS